MNIKPIREKTGLSQKEFGLRLGLTSQSITKYEAGYNVSETVKKLIRYEFAEFLTEEERLVANPLNIDDLKRNAALKKEVQELKAKLENLQKYNNLQDKTIKSLDDQVKMYKDQLKTKEKSKTV